jgi:hypothetical protein
MKHCVVSHDDSITHDEPPAGSARPNLFGGIALAFMALAYVSAPYVDFAAIGSHGAPIVEPVAVMNSVSSEAFYLDGTLLAAHPLGFAPRTFSHSAPLRSDLVTAPAPSQIAAAPIAAPRQPAVFRTVQSVPLPTPRPVDLGSSASPSLQAAVPGSKVMSTAAPDPFEKLFGKRRPAMALAYAATDGGVFNDGRSIGSGLPPNDGLTAIYDITARTVYLPDGTKLEAHSGLRDKMDDPRHVHVRMHGATPPHVYDLTPREALFHGVEALRLVPVGGDGAIFGRTGLLTHSYLLGPNGDSNGCVSFKDYEPFLRAYKSGAVKRLVVVASVDDPQLDLRVAERQVAKPARTYRLASSASSQLQDDRYFPAFTSSLASRTSSSARSLNSSPE